MDSTAYYEVCQEIDLLEERLDGLDDEMRLLNRQMSGRPATKLVASYSGMPSAQFVARFDIQFQRSIEISEKIAEVKDILNLKNDLKKRMEAKLQQYEGLEYRVAYKRDVERKPLNVIAVELKYSYDYIRKVSGRVKRMRDGTNKAQNNLQTVI